MQIVYDETQLTPIIDAQRLPGSLWCLCPYFNLTNSVNRTENFRVFYHRMMEHGVNILFAEQALHDKAFELQDIVHEHQLPVRLCADKILWQQQTLINLLLEHLPDDCDKVCWIDSDVMFGNEDWHVNVSRMLEQYKMVQCFSHMAYLPRGVEFVDELEINSFPQRMDDCSRWYGYINGISNADINMSNGHAGLVWAARRSVLEEVGGLYDECIFGGGDQLIARAAAYAQYDAELCVEHTRFQLSSYFNWAERMRNAVWPYVSHVPGIAYHLYHGSLRNRGYEASRLVLKELGYNPYMHITKRSNGLWTVTDNGESMWVDKEAVKFFKNRKEDF